MMKLENKGYNGVAQYDGSHTYNQYKLRKFLASDKEYQEAKKKQEQEFKEKIEDSKYMYEKE